MVHVLEAVDSAIGEFISVVRADGSLVHVTDDVEDVLGYAPDEMIGEHMMRFVHPDDVQRLIDGFLAHRRLTDDERPGWYAAALRLLRAGGDWIAGYAQVQIREVDGEQGRVTRFFALPGLMDALEEAERHKRGKSADDADVFVRRQRPVLREIAELTCTAISAGDLLTQVMAQVGPLLELEELLLCSYQAETEQAQLLWRADPSADASSRTVLPDALLKPPQLRGRPIRFDPTSVPGLPMATSWVRELHGGDFARAVACPIVDEAEVVGFLIAIGSVYAELKAPEAELLQYVTSHAKPVLLRALYGPTVGMPEPTTTRRGVVIASNGVVLDRRLHRVEVAGDAISLSPKEYEIFEQIMSRGGSVISKEEIASRIWGVADVGTLKTLETHIARLRAKLPPTPAGDQFVKTVRGVGLRFETGD